MCPSGVLVHPDELEEEVGQSAEVEGLVHIVVSKK